MTPPLASDTASAPAPRSKGRVWLANLTTLAIAGGVALLLGELLLRLVVNPGDFLAATVIDDDILGRRIEPFSAGHDALGFRNPAVPERAEIITLGDSQTYGVMAASDGTWPHQLGALLQQPVYNMALGGYGPLEYLYLAGHEARKLRPRLLLVGFYFGNDLIDAYLAAHERPYWFSWREAGAADVGQRTFDRPGQDKRFAALRDWLSKHSVLYEMLKAGVFPRQGRTALQETPDALIPWFDPSKHSVRTIFRPQKQLPLLDPEFPVVQEGLRITKEAFTSLTSDTDAQGIQLLVVLIPTKERAYCRYLEDSGERIPDTLVKLCFAEERVKEDLVQFFGTRKIAYVDVTGAMEESIQKHVQIYPVGSDGHPLATGYGAIARAVYDAVLR